MIGAIGAMSAIGADSTDGSAEWISLTDDAYI
jgi:hypothetical protein